MPEQPATQPESVDLKGIGVSPGVAVGPVFLLKTDEEDRIVERTISEAEIPREVARFEEALILTRQQIHEIQQRIAQAIGQENASIFMRTCSSSMTGPLWKRSFAA